MLQFLPKCELFVLKYRYIWKANIRHLIYSVFSVSEIWKRRQQDYNFSNNFEV